MRSSKIETRKFLTSASDVTMLSAEDALDAFLEFSKVSLIAAVSCLMDVRSFVTS